jgi:hypothetical protein
MVRQTEAADFGAPVVSRDLLMDRNYRDTSASAWSICDPLGGGALQLVTPD